MRKIVLLAIAMALILGTVWAGNSESPTADDGVWPVIITNAI